MSDLNLRYLRLVETQLAIARVCDAFEAVDGDASDAAGAVGHWGLSGRVSEFADGWNSRRRTMTRDLHNLADGLGAVADTFLALDQRLSSETPRAHP